MTTPTTRPALLCALLLLACDATRPRSDTGRPSGPVAGAPSGPVADTGEAAPSGSGEAAAMISRVAAGTGSAPRDTLSALRVAASPAVDGRLDEPDWLSTARTATFIDAADPGATVAFTQARALWDDAGLTLGFYAADEHIAADDVVGVEVRGPDGVSVYFDLGPPGALTCRSTAGDDCERWPGAAGAAFFDGTPDDPSDDDEEWTAELRLAWDGLGLDAPPDALDLRFYRRDQLRGRAPRTLSWGGAEALGELTLQRP